MVKLNKSNFYYGLLTVTVCNTSFLYYHAKVSKRILYVESSIGKWGLGQNLKMENPKFPNLLVLEHLKSHFIKPSLLNKFLICFEINGLKYLKLTILRFLSRTPTYLYYSNSSKNIFYC